MAPPVKQTLPKDREMAGHIYWLCHTDFSQEYVVGEIIRRLESARKQGAEDALGQVQETAA